MNSKTKSLILIAALLAILLIEPLHQNIVMAQQSVNGTQDNTFGAWMFSAGTTVPAGAPTDDIIERAVFYNLLDYIGDTAAEVYQFGWGLSEPTPGQEDKTLAEVIQGLSAIDDFGYLANAGDDDANFDAGKNGYFLGGFDPSEGYFIVSDGTTANGVLGPSGATSATKAEEAINGYEIFIFEDAELSGMNITLSNKLGLSITFSIADLQVNPPTDYGADDTLIAIDLDALPGFDGTFIDTIRIKDDSITSPSTFGDTTLEIDAIAIRKSVKGQCPVRFFTDPSTVGNITFKGVTYTYGQLDTFPYGTSGLVTANAPEDWIFDHWATVGNVQISSTTANPTTFTITCGGNLTAVFMQTECPVTFYTDPSTIGNITFQGETYTYAETDSFTYGTSGLATANAPTGWVFDHWVVSGNVQISSTTNNPATVSVLCGGTLKAFFKQQILCTVTFYTSPCYTGSITFQGETYTYAETDSFPYGTSGLATANAPVGWMFDYWVVSGNVQISSTKDNPATVTVLCGGTLKAFFKKVCTKCTVTFYTDPCYAGNITFKGETYTYAETDSFTYGTSGLATANAPTGWVFDHWVVTGNVQISSTTDNPATVTILCGGTLAAVFVEEQGCGDLGTIGYWKHIFYEWKSGKGAFKNYIEEVLVDFLEKINVTSRVFSENYTLTLQSAYDLLWSHDSSMRTKALKQCLASWLNWANDAVTMSQMVDTDYNGVPDMTFGAAMTIVEDILRDPTSSLSDLEYGKDICDSINNM